MDVGFKTEVFVKFRKNQDFPGPALAPLKEVQALMMLAIKDFFSEKLSPEYLPWRDLAAALWHSFPTSPTFKPDTVMVKLKNIYDNSEENIFKFTVVLLKRPQFYHNSTDPFFAMWSDPESDLDDEEETEMIYCFDVTVTAVVIDTLEKSSALVVGKMKNPQNLMVYGRPLPNDLLSLIQTLSDQNIDD